MIDSGFLSQGWDFLGSLKAKLGDLRGTFALANELIQNADDAHARRLVLEITPQALTVCNDATFKACDAVLASHCSWDVVGDGRKCCDFHAFRRVASGHKEVEADTTGAFGIGFISVYQITDRPVLESGEWRWEMNPELEESHRITYRRLQPLRPDTHFTFPWALERTKLRERLAIEPMTPASIAQMAGELRQALTRAAPFLKHLEYLELRCPDAAPYVVHCARDVAGDQILVEAAGVTRHWLKLQVDFASQAAALRARHPEIAAKRKSLVTVAVPLDEELDSGLLYASLPTEQTIELPVLINADFYPATDRKRILFEADFRSHWNRAAMAAAAFVLADSLPRLKEHLEPAALWGLIGKAKTMAEQAERAGADPMNGLTFWQALKPRLEKDACVWTADEKWAEPSAVRHAHESEAFATCRPWLEELGVRTVHPALRPRYSVLSAVGVKVLDVDVLAQAHVAAGLNERCDVHAVPAWLQVDAHLHALKTLLSELIGQVPPSRLKAAKAQLSALALWRPLSGQFALATELLRADEVTRRVFDGVPVGDVWLDEAQSEVLGDLVPELSVELTIRLLHEVGPDRLPTEPNGLGQWPVPFLAWLDGRQAELQSPFIKAALRELPIWPSNGHLVELTGLAAPGDFEDPLHLAKLLDSETAARFRTLVTDCLGAHALSLSRYLRMHVPAAFSSSDPPNAAVRTALLKLLSRHIGQIREDVDVREAMAAIPLVPCEDGEYRTASTLYFHCDEIELLFGADQERYVDRRVLGSIGGARDVLVWLGVRSIPSPQDVIARVQELIGSSRLEDAKPAMAQLFGGLCEFWPQLCQRKSALHLLKTLAWLPGTQADGWFKPNQLYTVFRAFLFQSQANFLALPQPLQVRAQAKPAGADESLIDFLGIRGEPQCEQVVAHLLHQARAKEKVNSEVYRYLDNHHKDQAIARLKAEPCLLVEGGAYVVPGRAILSAHKFGRFRVALSEDWLSCTRLMSALGVATGSDARVACQVLKELAQDYADRRKLDDADRDTCLYCWTLLAGEDQADVADLFKPLQSLNVVPNGDGFLRRPAEVFFEDRPGLAAKVGPAVQVATIKRPEGAWTAMSVAGVKNLSQVVEAQLVDCDDLCANPQWDHRLRERWPLVRRIQGAQQALHPSSCPAKPPEVWQASRMSVSYSLGENQGVSERSLAFLDVRATRVIVSVAERGAMAAMARELSFWLQPDGQAGLLATALNQLLSAESVDAAQALLSDLGVAELDLGDWQGASSGESLGMGGQEITEAEQDMAGSSELVEPRADADEERPAPADDDDARMPPTGNLLRETANQGVTGTSQSPRTASDPQRRREPSSKTADKRAKPQDATLILRSYVRPPKAAGTEAGEIAGNEHQLDVDRRGTDKVLAHERTHGRTPKKMDHFNKGYDIESTDAQGRVRYIEVKSMSGPWKSFSVGLSPEQIRFAAGHGADAWLYVVEGLDSEAPQIHTICDPARRISEYRFDEGWRHAAEVSEVPKRRSLVNMAPPVQEDEPLGSLSK